MAGVTFYVVVPFMRDADSIAGPGEAKEPPNREAARRRASTMATAAGNVGAIAFSRSGDPDTGEFTKGTVIAAIGEVDLDAMAG